MTYTQPPRRSRTGVGLILIIIGCFALLPAGRLWAQAPPPPLRVEIVASDPVANSITLAVTNTTGALVTAYAIELTVRQGREAPVTTQRQIDGWYLADTRALLVSGQTVELQWPLPRDASRGDVAITATAVIFDDATVGGVESLGEQMLERRAARRDELGHWLSTIKHLMIKHSDRAELLGMTQSQRQKIRISELAAQMGSSAIQKAFAELEPMVLASARASSVAETLGDNLRRIAVMEPAERDTAVHIFLDTLERRHATAVKHAGRQR